LADLAWPARKVRGSDENVAAGIRRASGHIHPVTSPAPLDNEANRRAPQVGQGRPTIALFQM